MPTEAAPPERLRLLGDARRGDWFSRYEAVLGASGIGETSRTAIEGDARRIVEGGVLGAGPAGAPDWPSSRVRSGAVMGAVQSGKTASMMAVTALSLDSGVDAVVILAGTRTALWLQTLERVVDQLDAGRELGSRVLLPGRRSLASGPPEATHAYRLTAQRAAKAVARRLPLLAVVMKNAAHVAEMASTLHDVVYPEVVKAQRPFHLLVLDDEADDSSVVGHEDPSHVRQVPRRILDLWESRRTPGATCDPRVHATYVGYTATPQASFLQDRDNLLAPRDFVAALRTPGADGHPLGRTPTYRVPEGPRAWYTGGDVYYRRLAGVPLCRSQQPEDEKEALQDAVRAYLVAAAVKVLRQEGRLTPAQASGVAFASSEDARARTVSPMSMLVHPSSAKDEHFRIADQILTWSGGGSPGRDQDRTLRTDGLAQDMERNREAWLRWLSDYGSGAELVGRVLEDPVPRPVPAVEAWAEIRHTILNDVAPATAVAVINSDEHADERPRFTPVGSASGAWSAPPNLSTIFVSGNVMSRGLTLEGLLTTYFSRQSNDPLADTQMQMQRWFGYRGTYIDLCRVFMRPEQLRLFSQYHENDEALRTEILASSREDAGSLTAVTVLQGRAFRATGKFRDLRGGSLWPGPRPFVTLLNPPGADEENQRLVGSLLAEADPVGDARDEARGLLAPHALDLAAAADVLDALTYEHHGRDERAGGAADVWRSLERQLDMDQRHPAYPLYRAPARDMGVDLGLGSPYWVAAYLRLWGACLDQAVPGMTSTDEPPQQWSLLDLAVRREQQPRFWLGMRFGGGPVVESGPLASLPAPVRQMQREVEDDVMRSKWGSRNQTADGIRGDEHFDLLARGEPVVLTQSGARPVGSDGLLLFHPVARGEHVSLAVGVVLPLGGPDHVRAHRGTSYG